MEQRLSDIARSFNVNITELAEFFREHGFDCKDEPNELITEEAAERAEYNFPAYLASKFKRPVKLKQREAHPLELKIIQAADKEKKLVERIVGFTQYEWRYFVSTYQGECSHPVPFTLFDEVICDLLAVEKMTAERMGELLGLDPEKDPAGRMIISKAIADLVNDRMIVGDDEGLELTATGREYAAKGVKFSTYKRNFDLYFDMMDTGRITGKEIFGSLRSELLTGNEHKWDPPQDISDIRKFAEVQAPEIHLPANGNKLLSAEYKRTQAFAAKLWVCLLENFRDNTLRTLVYDEVRDTIIPELSRTIDAHEGLKKQLLDQLIQEDDSITETREGKPEEQLRIEKDLIGMQAELDKAIDSHEEGKAREILHTASVMKKHFDSIEFEVELARLFKETSDQIWMLSPWVRKNAFRRRSVLIEDYLKKGGTVFVAFSLPEKPDDIMADAESRQKLLELEKHYSNFYFCELPPFHYKNVWLRTGNASNAYYTGSFNILSFFVKEGQRYVRQEKMVLTSWNPEVEKEFEDVFHLFGRKYFDKATADLQKIANRSSANGREHIKALKSFDLLKLRVFTYSQNSFEAEFTKIETIRQGELSTARSRIFESELGNFESRIKAIKQPMPVNEKNRLVSEFKKLREEFNDLIKLQFKAHEVQNLLDGLRYFTNSQGNNKNTSKNKKHRKK
jgi:hypothetical protein